MKNRFRLFRRGWGTFYCEDTATGTQQSLHTRDRHEAYRLVAAKNENDRAPAFSRHLARVYWNAGDLLSELARTVWLSLEDQRLLPIFH